MAIPKTPNGILPGGPRKGPDESKGALQVCKNWFDIPRLTAFLEKRHYWLVVWLPFFYVPINIGFLIIPIDSYFSEGWPNHQPDYDDKPWCGKPNFMIYHGVIAHLWLSIGHGWRHGCTAPSQWQKNRIEPSQEKRGEVDMNGVDIIGDIMGYWYYGILIIPYIISLGEFFAEWSGTTRGIEKATSARPNRSEPLVASRNFLVNGGRSQACCHHRYAVFY